MPVQHKETSTQAQHALELKAYQEKVTAQVEQVKAKLHELEAQFKAKKAGAEIEAIHGLRMAQHEIEKKTKELKAIGATVAEAKAAQMKAEIDAALANVNAKLGQLSGKVPSHSTP
jgi:alkylhydroperoxidase/carboxymuconolactone decarboxylase family protein YurZ